ncbi:MAG: class I SAM-dependent methyltransferase [Dehalococcoidia bacterium]|nr:class I SAM-dependent methyltransferase [Dehalococcoidia bacterium]
MENVPDQAQVFDRIAPGWYGFRHHTIFQKELAELAKRWQSGRLLNLGCGHGADFVPFKSSFELCGVDISGGMLGLAERYAAKNNFHSELIQADMRRLPFADGLFDYALAVASLHHLPGQEEQMRALAELTRVLKPGGEAFITVWNRTQPRFWGKSKELLIPWRYKDGVALRYYYLFTYGEIAKLVRHAGLRLLKLGPERRYRWPVKLFSRNICLLAGKP